MNRNTRLAAILDILGRRPVTGQRQLRDLLAERGISVSQSSLSRDLKELGVHRRRTAEGLFAYVAPAERPPATTGESFRLRFRTSVTGVRRVEFVILVSTPPGEAQLIGRLLDAASLPGLAGTVAGDDTVIGIAAGTRAARELETRFTELIG